MREDSVSLNTYQKQAVGYDGGHLLIVAGPGTGKTHTLTCRIAHVAQALPQNEKILAITFTNKAAQEMRERIADSVDSKQIYIGTFHQFCARLLRENALQAGVPQDFKIADPEECEALMTGILTNLTKKDRRLRLEEISQWKSLRFDAPMPDHVRDYVAACRQENRLDYDDLLWETWNLFEANREVLENVRSIYAHIFVDEYQDINRIQHELLQYLVGNDNTITAIGDPNQAIYGFRGSDVAYFSSFDKDFENARIMTLCDNYRSASNLLDASSQVMAPSRSRHVPDLTAKLFLQGRLVFHACPTDKAEAEYVVHQIEKMVGGTSMFSQDTGRVDYGEEGDRSFGDIAVLYRLKAQVRELKKAFDRMGIPYHVSGEVKDQEEFMDDVYGAGEEAVFEAEKVSLLTLHAAKGLEFPVVFIVGCEQNLIPLHLEGLDCDSNEERRLFYVGMTRAKERLFLVRAKRRMLYGRTLQHEPSPYWADIEEELKEYEKSNPKPKRKDKDDPQIRLF